MTLFFLYGKIYMFNKIQTNLYINLKNMAGPEASKDIVVDTPAAKKDFNKLVTDALADKRLNNTERQEILAVLEKMNVAKEKITQETVAKLEWFLNGANGGTEFEKTKKVLLSKISENKAMQTPPAPAEASPAVVPQEPAAAASEPAAPAEPTPAPTAPTPEQLKTNVDAAKDLLWNWMNIADKAGYDGLVANLKEAWITMPTSDDLLKSWIDLTKIVPSNPLSMSFEWGKVNVYFGKKEGEGQAGWEFVRKYWEIKDWKFDKSWAFANAFSSDILKNNNQWVLKGKDGSSVYEWGYKLNGKWEALPEWEWKKTSKEGDVEKWTFKEWKLHEWTKTDKDWKTTEIKDWNEVVKAPADKAAPTPAKSASK